MKRKKHLKTIAMLLTLITIISMMNVSVFAATEIHEQPNQETSNNQMSGAIQTEDDNDNYGKIINSTDVDWWKFYAISSGNTNIWLGSIPSGCDYDIYLYNSSGTYMACSVQTTGTQEIMKCRLAANQLYYVKIVTKNNGSTSQEYKMRIKYKMPNGKAELFGFEYTGVSSYNPLSYAQTNFSSAGYTATRYNNKDAVFVLNKMTGCRALAIMNQASAGQMDCYNSHLYPNVHGSMLSNDAAVGSLGNDGDLNDVRLVAYIGDYSAVTGTHGNLIEKTIAQGASCCTGWCADIDPTATYAWQQKFFTRCLVDNKNIEAAMIYADDYIYQYYNSKYAALHNRYSGTSRKASIII